MALTERTYTERVLIALNPDGTFKGAHAEQLREIRDGDKVLSAQQSTTPLTADALTTVLPDTATMLTSIKSIEAERDAALAAQGAAEKERDAAIAERDALQAQIDAAADAVVNPTTPSADDIRREAQRRIIVLVGARDFDDCVVKQLNATMRAVFLTDKRLNGGTLTPTEEAEAQALRNLKAAIDGIRDKSNALEATLPIDYQNDTYWT